MATYCKLKKAMRDEIDEPIKEDAMNQLEILARRGYLSISTYEYS